MSVGVSRVCPIFLVPPIISGTGKATDFKFCRNIHRVNRNKSPWKCCRGRSQGVPKIFRAPICRAHCAVIFATAQLSCLIRIHAAVLLLWHVTCLVSSTLSTVMIVIVRYALYQGWWSLIVSISVNNFAYFYAFHCLRVFVISTDGDMSMQQDFLSGLLAGMIFFLFFYCLHYHYDNKHDNSVFFWICPFIPVDCITLLCGRSTPCPKISATLASNMLNSVWSSWISMKYRTLHYLNIAFCHAYYDVRTLPCELSVT